MRSQDMLGQDRFAPCLDRQEHDEGAQAEPEYRSHDFYVLVYWSGNELVGSGGICHEPEWPYRCGDGYWPHLFNDCVKAILPSLLEDLGLVLDGFHWFRLVLCHSFTRKTHLFYQTDTYGTNQC